MSKTAKGQSIKLLLSLEGDESVAAYAPLKSGEDEKFIVFITRKGYIKKIDLDDFRNVRKSGIIAIKLDEDDCLIAAIVTNGKNELLIATEMGRALRLKESTVRPMGRAARGVTGIRLREGDYVCGVRKVIDAASLLVLTANGYGKRVSFKNFTVHGRGTGGQIFIKAGEKTGKVVGIRAVTKGDEFVIITGRGMIIKLKVNAVSIMGRNAGGIKLVNIKEPDSAVAIARIVQD